MSTPQTLAEPGREALIAAVCAAPKAELHVHIEGTLEPELAFALARRNGVALRWPSSEALRAAYAFDSLQSFLDLYYAGCDVLRTEQDFFDLAWAYFQRAAADHVVRAEVFFDPQSHTARGIGFDVFMPGLLRAARRAQDELGMRADYILCVLRHLSEDDGLATLEAASPWREHIIGLGLDSSERGNPPQKFARLYAQARAQGLRLVAHAGEEGPAASVRDALDLLGAERIDHGVHAADDPALVRRLAAEGVALTVCPLSNVKLRVFPDMAAHNLPALLHAGVKVMVNSDDPAYFGGYVNANYRALLAAHPALDSADAYRLLRNSLEASFAPAGPVAAWAARLDAHWQAQGLPLPPAA
ncbi:MAG: adenosine deaminase [Thiomonas sp. 13-66-29]|nr:MAG: adenosine deaminase [Thiomonas sp. 13-66-29]